MNWWADEDLEMYKNTTKEFVDKTSLGGVSSKGTPYELPTIKNGKVNSNIPEHFDARE